MSATSDTDDEPVDPPAECPPRNESISAGFSISIDDQPVDIDYSVYFGVISPVLPEGWNIFDTMPEIDGMCDVVEQVEGSLTLACPDLDGVMRTFEVQLSASETLSTSVGPGPVHAWYLVNDAHDELEANPDTIAHAFVVSNDDGIILAGVDGRYSVYSSLPSAWPDWPQAATGDGPCDVVGEGSLSAQRTLASIVLEDGSSVEVYDGSAHDLGSYRALVEIATTHFASDPHGEDVDVHTARWLLGMSG